MSINHRDAVVVTGASSGIGRACALALDRAGYQVFATVRKEKDAESLRQAASAYLTPVFMDVTAEASKQPVTDQSWSTEIGFTAALKNRSFLWLNLSEVIRMMAGAFISMGLGMLSFCFVGIKCNRYPLYHE